jgi:hypothetical protein
VGCSAVREDWRGYNEIRFYIALDNYLWEVAPVGAGAPRLIHERKANYRAVLSDNAGRELQKDLDYPMDMWGKDKYVIGTDVEDPHPTEDDYTSKYLPRWRGQRLPFSSLQPAGTPGSFDFSHVKEVRLQVDSLARIWTREVGETTEKRKLAATNSGLAFWLGESVCPVILGSGDNRLQYDPAECVPALVGAPSDVPCDPGGDCWGIGPVFEADMRTTLRVDRIILPGASMLDHGLPPRLPLEITRWRELTAEEAAR